MAAEKKNYRMTISYDGTRYAGWQRQKKNEQTIQGKLEHVLSVMEKEEQRAEAAVQVIGAGRTDAGVHARAMTANVFLRTERTAEEVGQYLNQYLPEDISVDQVKIASDRFHSRYNAIGKTYRYTCWYGTGKPVFDRRYVWALEERPDVEQMRRAAEFLTGRHDFKAFCGNPRYKKSTVREVDRIEIREEWPYLRLYFHGTGFLQNMVRILTGTLLEVGAGRMQAEDMPRILAAGVRAQAGPTAPARGLCLLEVDYD